MNCDTTAPGGENPNVEWAASHCDSIPRDTGVSGWGNSYDIPSLNAPFEGNYAMRCEYPHWVAPNCLCPNKNPPEGGAGRCSQKRRECDMNILGFFCIMSDREWGKKNYSSPEYCTKLNVIIDRPFGTACSEHAHCTVGLQYSDGVCSTCPEHVCPDRTQSDKLSAWGKTCKYGEYKCPHGCARKGEGCSPTNLGLGCCEGLKCS